MTVIQMNSDRRRHSIAAERLCRYKRQHRHSMLQLAQFKSTTYNSAMSATYSKNIQTVSFFMWKKLEFRYNTGWLDDTFSVLWQHSEVFPRGLYPYTRFWSIWKEREMARFPFEYTINNKSLTSNLALDSLQKSWKDLSNWREYSETLMWCTTSHN